VAELGAGLQSHDLDIGAAFPVNLPSFLMDTIEGDSRDDANTFCNEPEGEILGQGDLAPEGKEEDLGQEAAVDEIIRSWPVRIQKHSANKMKDQITKSEPKSFETIFQWGSRQCILIILIDALLELLHLNLWTNEVTSNKEVVRQHLYQGWSFLQSCFLLILGQSFWTHPLGSVTIITIKCETN